MIPLTKNFAHRGFSGKFPENTMLAFEKAVETGCDGIELDVQLSKDGVPVVIHDENTGRTTGRNGWVHDLTLDELRKLDAGKGSDAALGPLRIPALEEYFAYIRDKDIVTDIELKDSVFRYDGIEEKVIGLIRKYGVAEKVIFSSFNHQSMQLCKKLCPAIPCAFLTSDWLVGAGAYAHRRGVEFINPLFPFLTEENIRELRENGIRAMAWTVDLEKWMKRLAEHGVSAVITNRPDLFRKVLDSLGH